MTSFSACITDSSKTSRSISAIGANVDANPDANTKDLTSFILRKIEQNQHVTQTELANAAGVSRRTVQRAMQQMVEQKLITRVGSTHGYWKIES